MFKGIPLAVGVKVAFGVGAGPPAAITVMLAVEGSGLDQGGSELGVQSSQIWDRF